jgi:hypothetical protein
VIIPALGMAKTAKEILRSNLSLEDLNQWFAESSIPELEEFIRLAPSHDFGQHIEFAQKFLHRKIAKEALHPHWSMKWGFFVAVLATIFAAIAAWPVIQGWLPTSPPAHTDSSFQLPQSNSAPTTVPTAKTTNAVAVP